MPFAMAVTVLVSSYVIRILAMWRQAPITAAIVIAGGLQHHEKLTGMEQGVHRVAEVLFGCVLGIGVAWVLSKAWPLPESGATNASKKQGAADPIDGATYSVYQPQLESWDSSNKLLASGSVVRR